MVSPAAEGPRKARIAVLVSGGGTNLQALIDAQGKVITDGEIVLVIANNSKAYALERAANAGIDSAVVLKKELGHIRDKTIVITGASSGIGKEVLDRLAEPSKNNKVLATSRTIEKLKGYGSNVTLFNSDVSTKEGVDRVFEKAGSLFGKIDLVIANAGAPYYEKFDYVNWERIQKIFDLNTIYKYEVLLGDSTIAENREKGSFIWENYFYEDEMVNEYDLTLFIREKNDLYRKYEEFHYQKAYELEQVKALLQQAGMEFVAAYDAFTHDPVTAESERMYIIARPKRI